MHKGFNNVYLIVALVASSFAAGRFYANGSLLEENQKLQESVRLLRSEKIGVVQEGSAFRAWRDEKRPASAVMAPAPAHEQEAKPATPAETPAPAAALERPRTELAVHDAVANKAGIARQTPPPVLETQKAASTLAIPNGRKTSKKWVSDLGDNVQGTATYWRCNNATLAASGMDYYAYGSIPASRLKKRDHAYSVRDGKAIVVSGCWSPKLGKAILYRKADGRRWEPPFNVNNGAWTAATD